MRNIIASIVIFAVLITTIIISINYIDRTCLEFESMYIQLEHDVNTKSWDKAYSSSITLLNKWKKSSHTLSMFVNHQEIDNINNELWKLIPYTQDKNTDEALASIHVLKFYVEHIIQMENINLQNIF
ncbi:MAG: DUF4363 family protein [Bacillota bacterium]|nr:DUF4363 family protein [Bacillota bacterium]